MSEIKHAAILFPGQGSQYSGMGRDLAEKWPDAMDVWKLAEKISGHPLREIFWEGEEKDMAETSYLQPGLSAVNLSVWLYLKNRFFPSCSAGHSLGEYCALCAAGVLSLEDCLQVVSLRGRLMGEAGAEEKGKMAAIVKLSQDRVEEIVQTIRKETGKYILIANYNTPAQFVVSGEDEAVDKVVEQAKADKGRGIVLPVSGAFHSPLMQEAADELAVYMERLDWNSPDFPVYLNSTADFEADERDILHIMQKQMVLSVYWIQLVQNIWENKLSSFLEVGPKNVLSKMVPQILGKDKELCVRTTDSLENMDILINEVG